MSRIKLIIPENKLFSVILPVRITDINYGNHLGHDSLVSLLQEARTLWLANYGFTELNMAGKGLIMGDLAVEYKSESFYGDVLQISLYAGEVGRVNFDLYYVTINQDGQLIAKAKTGMICYDYVLKKISKIPASLAAVLNSLHN